MATVEVTEKNVNEIADKVGVIFYFRTERTEKYLACRRFDLLFERVSERNDDLTFARIDVDQDGGIDKIVETIAAKAYGELPIDWLPMIATAYDGVWLVKESEALEELVALATSELP